MRNATHTPTIPGPVEIRPGTLHLDYYQYRSRVIDYNGSYFDFFLRYINCGRYWEIDILQLPNYRGRSTSAGIIHTLPSARGGRKICVAEGHEPRSEYDAKKLSMAWCDLQAEYIKTGVTPDQQIARNHR